MIRVLLRTASGLVVLALTSCGSSSPPSPTTIGNAATEGSTGACPPASQLALVVATTPVPGYGMPDTTFWRLPQVILEGDHDAVFPAPVGYGAYRVLDAEAARAVGGGELPASVWIFAQDGAPPCRAQVRNYFGVREGEGPVYTSVGAELTGCADGIEPWTTRMVALSPEAPTDCRWHESALVASHALEGEEDRGPLPAALEALLPQRPCAAPGCERRHSLSGVELGAERGYYNMLVSWLHPTPGQDECSWQVEDSFLHVRTGAAPNPVAVPHERHWISGGFTDAGGPRYVVLQDNGEYEITRVAPDGALAPETEVRWQIPHEESYTPTSLGPYCGP